MYQLGRRLLGITKGFKSLHSQFRPDFKNKAVLSKYSTFIESKSKIQFQEKLNSGPSLQDFIKSETSHKNSFITENEEIPYVNAHDVHGYNRKVYIRTYGCQMNVNDTEIIWSILKKSGFCKTDNEDLADVILIVTCSIRDGAEQKIWNLLRKLKTMKEKRKNSLKIGILGCMAERLKKKLLEKEKAVDIIAGPDSYRDLPRLLTLADSGEEAVNVILSLEETYADIVPVRSNPESKSAFVSIMRGCDNMCTYCIVPFTRGKERSRSILSILDEVRLLSDQGVKQITLLGQNVNSYRDISEYTFHNSSTNLAQGFKTVYKPKYGGLRFADLLDKVSCIDPEIRIRFTSPHPKDFPDEVLQMIADRPNICNHLHMPAQSGNTAILEQMRRGYTREAYIDLVHHIKDLIPDISLTSDFICGFCGETEEAHKDTISLLKLVKYSFIFAFPYSMRERTRAHYRLKDDVLSEVKNARVNELLDTFRTVVFDFHKSQIGTEQLVLVEGLSKKSMNQLVGRNDGNTKVIFPQKCIVDKTQSNELKPISAGSYIAVKIEDCTSHVLLGEPLYQTTLQEFNRRKRNVNCQNLGNIIKNG